jgi:hypothetical protein
MRNKDRAVVLKKCFDMLTGCYRKHDARTISKRKEGRKEGRKERMVGYLSMLWGPSSTCSAFHGHEADIGTEDSNLQDGAHMPTPTRGTMPTRLLFPSTLQAPQLERPYSSAAGE